MGSYERETYLKDIASAPVEFIGDPYESDDPVVRVAFDGSYTQLESFFEFEYEHHVVERLNQPPIFLLLLPKTAPDE